MPYYRCAACGLTSYSPAAHSSAGVCPTCSATLTHDSKVDVRPGSKHDVVRTVLARPEAPAEARRALVGLVLPETTRDDLALIVSELVTNSVRHAGLSPADPITVQLVNGSATVRLTVHDGGRGFASSGPRESGAALMPDGRGLLIVAKLADRWGVDSDSDGCTVWCELAVEERPAAAPERDVTTRSIHELAMATAKAAV
jgi:anti-sigma regulatory factor (Ser/Thr protein kinase)